MENADYEFQVLSYSLVFLLWVISISLKSGRDREQSNYFIAGTNVPKKSFTLLNGNPFRVERVRSESLMSHTTKR